MSEEVIIIGGGLAGCEAAWQIAERGLQVKLIEMRPKVMTEVHQTSLLAELVCSNSLGSQLSDRAPGMLINELRMIGSLLIKCADLTRVPAGGALAVDRRGFSREVTQHILNHKNIRVIREEASEIPPEPCIIASGPLTSKPLSDSLGKFTGVGHLFFYDALAPVVTHASIDKSIAFESSRYGRGELEQGDYINCPLTKDEYYEFVEYLRNAETIELRPMEQEIKAGVRAGKSKYFESCLPVEEIARRGVDSLAFGPMKPVGLIDPRTNRRPYAVVQLRRDDLAGSLYNIVGFQTNLKYKEQQNVFNKIPGLAQAKFVRFGQMHRNTYLFSPEVLHTSMQSKKRDDFYIAGQLTGVEGYVGNIATGFVAGLNLANLIRKKPQLKFPKTTMIGALCHYITHASEKDFQPMKANLGLLPDLERDGHISKNDKRKMLARRSFEEVKSILKENIL